MPVSVAVPTIASIGFVPSSAGVITLAEANTVLTAIVASNPFLSPLAAAAVITGIGTAAVVIVIGAYTFQLSLEECDCPSGQVYNATLDSCECEDPDKFYNPDTESCELPPIPPDPTNPPPPAPPTSPQLTPWYTPQDYTYPQCGRGLCNIPYYVTFDVRINLYGVCQGWGPGWKPGNILTWYNYSETITLQGPIWSENVEKCIVQAPSSCLDVQNNYLRAAIFHDQSTFIVGPLTIEDKAFCLGECKDITYELINNAPLLVTPVDPSLEGCCLPDPPQYSDCNGEIKTKCGLWNATIKVEARERFKNANLGKLLPTFYRTLSVPGCVNDVPTLEFDLEGLANAGIPTWGLVFPSGQSVILNFSVSAFNFYEATLDRLTFSEL